MRVPSQMSAHRQFALTSVGKVCVAVAAAAFFTSALGSIVNMFVPNLWAAGGMAVVGLLYLGMGVAEIRLVTMPASATSADLLVERRSAARFLGSLSPITREHEAASI